jgi:hypothetical protein
MTELAPDGGELLPLPPAPVTDFTTVPDGVYLCTVSEVRTGTTRASDERWALRCTVLEGEHVGKHACWDSLVFSNRGRARARMVLVALGTVKGPGRASVEPDDLVGKRALVTVRACEYPLPTGERIRRSEVPYDGWREAPKDGAP